MAGLVPLRDGLVPSNTDLVALTPGLELVELESTSDLSEIGNKMSLVVRKPVFGVSDQVRHKPGCAVTEDK